MVLVVPRLADALSAVAAAKMLSSSSAVRRPLVGLVGTKCLWEWLALGNDVVFGWGEGLGDHVG